MEFEYRATVDASAHGRSLPSSTARRRGYVPLHLRTWQTLACAIVGGIALSLAHAGPLADPVSDHEPVTLVPARDGGMHRGLHMVAVKTSPAAKSPTPLRGTYWKLVALRGKPVKVIKDQREPHLLLDAKDDRASGSGGCNNVMGGFTLDGDRLHFTQMAGTMMMCPEGMEQEASFLKTLETVARFRIAGDALTLDDDKGKAVAKFRAIPQR